MTEAATSTVASAESRTPRRRMATTAIWLSAAALVLCAALVIPYRARADIFFTILLVLVAVAGVAGLVLGIRAHRPRAALASALIALTIGALLLAYFLVSLAALLAGPDQVELSGQGPTNMSATISSDEGTTTHTWPSNSSARLNTDGTWAELTLVAPEDSATQEVRCQIRWNDEVVVEEAGSGTVTCRYDAG